MAYITHPEPEAMALAIVHGTRHKLELWDELTADQTAAITAVVAADQAEALTPTDVLARLRQIAAGR